MCQEPSRAGSSERKQPPLQWLASVTSAYVPVSGGRQQRQLEPLLQARYPVQKSLARIKQPWALRTIEHEMCFSVEDLGIGQKPGLRSGIAVGCSNRSR